MAKNIDTSKKYEAIIYEKDDEGITTITFNQPDRHNAINVPLESGTKDAVADVNNDDRMRVLILTGAGSSFCSGYDVKEQLQSQDHNR